MSLFNFRNLSVNIKINSIVIIALIALAFVSIVSILDEKSSIMHDKQEKVRESVQTVTSLVNSYIEKEKKGELTQQQAQSEALNALNKIRYADGNYFFVMDEKVNLIMHPTKPTLNGKNVADMKDPNGVALFIEMANIAKAKGEGFLEYSWSKPDKDPKLSFKKLSYVKKANDWGWIIGTGIYIDDINKTIITIISKLGLIILVISIGFWIFASLIRKDIKSALDNFKLSMASVANGQSIKKSQNLRQDEFGEMEVSLVQMSEMLAQAHEQERLNEEKNKIEARKLLEDNVKQFEGKISPILNSFSNSTLELTRTSENMSKMINEVSERAQTVSINSSEAASSISSVASATEEMSASVQEISGQTMHFNTAVNAALEQMQRADKTSSELNSATARIGEIVDVIQTIAGQINLLALNATIESARAGDAGRGFAVVANEIKQLANQTEKATDEITSNISNIRAVSVEVIGALETIKHTILSVESISGSISAAVEEQSAVTREIAQNMSIASSGTSGIDHSIGEVSNFSLNASDAASQTQNAALELTSQSNLLSQEINNFISSVRAG